MDVAEIAPGLWRWTTYYPEWDDVVGCLYYEADDAIVLVDPLVPEDEPERFWQALDRDVERAGLPVHVLITVHWHARSSGEVAERYGGRLWAFRKARALVERRAGAPSDLYALGDVLPGGIEARASGRSNEALLWVPRHRALVAGDVLLGGPLRICPASWLPHGTGQDAVQAALRPLLELPVECILVSHGDPVLEGGGEALEALLGSGV
jgi:glyoxylase-like metal-dependent hydrolase (beta-lactamase superfamily II)